jgi:hypothetical protein
LDKRRRFANLRNFDMKIFYYLLFSYFEKKKVKQSGWRRRFANLRNFDMKTLYCPIKSNFGQKKLSNPAVGGGLFYLI